MWRAYLCINTGRRWFSYFPPALYFGMYFCCVQFGCYQPRHQAYTAMFPKPASQGPPDGPWLLSLPAPCHLWVPEDPIGKCCHTRWRASVLTFALRKWEWVVSNPTCYQQLARSDVSASGWSFDGSPVVRTRSPFTGRLSSTFFQQTHHTHQSVVRVIFVFHSPVFVLGLTALCTKLESSGFHKLMTHPAPWGWSPHLHHLPSLSWTLPLALCPTTSPPQYCTLLLGYAKIITHWYMLQ